MRLYQVIMTLYFLNDIDVESKRMICARIKRGGGGAGVGIPPEKSQKYWVS